MFAALLEKAKKVVENKYYNQKSKS